MDPNTPTGLPQTPHSSPLKEKKRAQSSNYSSPKTHLYPSYASVKPFKKIESSQETKETQLPTPRTSIEEITASLKSSKAPEDLQREKDVDQLIRRLEPILQGDENQIALPHVDPHALQMLRERPFDELPPNWEKFQ